ncbi:MAG TPA: SPOR domain-containing protein, partial [Thermoanaerobaculia bacterium]|nr:SPOR domain-containing protein [Thermoanaerobaculia bacterium]
MNEPSEATHYQIELTSRQVLTALAVLLTCLFAAFFAGVWIGRSAAAEQAALELASVGEDSRAEGQFEFFSRTTLPPGGGVDEEAEVSSSGGGDDSQRRSDRPADRSRPARQELDFGPDPDDEELETTDPESLFVDPAPAARSQELPPPEEMGREGRRRRPATRTEPVATDPLSETEPAEDRAAAQAADGAPTQPPARAAAAAEAGFHIQVLATSDRQKAQALVERLVDADFKAFLAPADEGGRVVYRVRVGPLPDRALAAGQAAELKSRWGLESWISPIAP